MALSVPMGGGIDDRSTPRSEFDPLHAEFHFTLDAAASHENALLPRYATKDGNYLHDAVFDMRMEITKEDGLTLPWMNQIVFFNPPYSQPEDACKPGCVKERCMPWGTRGHHITEYHAGVEDFVAKAWRETHDYYQLPSGELVACQLAVGYLPVRTEQPWWRKYVWDKDARGGRGDTRPGVEIRWVDHRVKFGGLDQGAPFPSVVVVWRPPA